MNPAKLLLLIGVVVALTLVGFSPLLLLPQGQSIWGAVSFVAIAATLLCGQDLLPKRARRWLARWLDF